MNNTPKIPYSRAGTFEHTWQEAKRQLKNKTPPRK